MSGGGRGGGYKRPAGGPAGCGGRGGGAPPSKRSGAGGSVGCAARADESSFPEDMIDDAVEAGGAMDDMGQVDEEEFMPVSHPMTNF